jgi:TolB-like protein/Flp pilus assembly protein TadD
LFWTLPCAFQVTRIKVECCRDERFVNARRVNPKNFFAELKRRNVYRVAIAYGVVAWLLMQAASILFPTFEAPSWTMKVFVAMTALGFPIALVLAWAFELTAEGIKRTDEIEPGRRPRNRGWLYVVVIAGAISVGLFFLGRYTASTKLSGSANAAAKSIAVLPFENLSEDKANAYFADGIQEEILTRLAKIADLKVISRTSTQRYQSKPANLSEIAKQLGVANILEGSVQKAGDSVRVSVNLIQAASDSHLWAESYDRRLIDVFQVESDVAQKIAASLEAKLTGREKKDISSAGTQNSQAYEAYLRALAEYRGDDYDSLQRALHALEEAVRADPDFAAAWARLARIQSGIYFLGFDQTEAARATARKALEVALRLQPELADAQMAKGCYEYWVVGDYDAARRTLEQLRSRWPNNADLVETLGYIALRQGRWKEGQEYIDNAIVLDPRHPGLRIQAASARVFLRDFPGALRTIDQALAVWPDHADLIGLKAIVYQAQGQLDQADALLNRLQPRAADINAVSPIYDQARLRRAPTAAIGLLRTLTNPPNSLPPMLDASYLVFLGELERLSGNINEARTSFTQAREELEKELKQQPQNRFLVSLLARTLAGLGEREAALREADHAVELLPSVKDARTGPRFEETRARIQARFGDSDRAIPALRHLLNIPYSSGGGSPLTPALLRLDPDFDTLRSDPRFQELCKDKQP